jgi:hypothetical protein
MREMTAAASDFAARSILPLPQGAPSRGLCFIEIRPPHANPYHAIDLPWDFRTTN